MERDSLRCRIVELEQVVAELKRSHIEVIKQESIINDVTLVESMRSDQVTTSFVLQQAETEQLIVDEILPHESNQEQEDKAPILICEVDTSRASSSRASSYGH